MHDIDKILDFQLLGMHKEAREVSDKLEELGPNNIPDPNGNLNNPDMWIRHSFNRGWFKIQEGNYQEGCRLLEYGRFISVYGSGHLKTNAPLYNPEQHDIKGKSILISLEGGYGDEIIHARFATSFKRLGADKVYLAADPSLHCLFNRIDGLDGVIMRNQAHTVQHDYWIPGFSAGWVAGHTFNDFPGKPYLTPNYDSVKIWKELIKAEENQIKVGIRWAGNPKFEHQQFRRFPPAFLHNLVKYPELKVFSFQRDHNTTSLPEGITDLQYFLISWEDTAAAIMNLDIVITSCTSIAHLSAAMGKETYVLVPILPYHTWTYNSPESDTSPYYETVKLFRQLKPNKWNDTFQKLYYSLEEKYNLKHVDMPDEDKVLKRINLGSGRSKEKNFLNVDKNSKVNPDIVVDLNTFPWPFKDDEFGHILAKDSIQYLGNTQEDFIKVLKEMYRISENGALWEIQVPHWRCDIALDDPNVKRVISPGMFHLFNQKIVLEKLKNNSTDDLYGFELDIDIELVDVKFEYLPHWKSKLENNEIFKDDLDYALNTYNNVAKTTMFLIQVHKPGRISKEEFEIELAKKISN